ncbi:phosphoenolpyruvate-utilizing N-terminal domain-containing protein [Streptomyces sp. NPDC002088]|uniref:phosphoenolpyruvate-utilizing N-terminal domain-containing protein n=1 Tax=Streptomyces sp. NPDC002088 TaxID=3154665 RepID=UPI003333CD41
MPPGTAAGPVAHLGRPPRPPADEQPAADIDAETHRVVEALETVAQGLEERGGLAGGQAAEVLLATALMARDPSLPIAVRTRLDAGQPTAAAVDATFEQHARHWAGRAVRRRNLQHSSGRPAGRPPPCPRPGGASAVEMPRHVVMCVASKVSEVQDQTGAALGST